MSIFVVNLRTHGDWENGIEYGQQATLIVEGRTLKEVEEKAIDVYCENILEHYGNINNLDATYCDYTKTTEATCNTCGKCVCEWSITAEARRMKKDETYKDSYSGITHYYNGLYNGSTSNIISDIAFDPEYNKTEATAETTEATEQPTEETAQTTEATAQTTEATETTEATAETTEATPPPTETTGKEVTGVTIIEHRQYNNGDKVIIKHNCFYNADEIIHNYHATDPSYICKYKGLLFGKDDNDYYVSEFHYEEQYL